MRASADITIDLPLQEVWGLGSAWETRRTWTAPLKLLKRGSPEGAKPLLVGVWGYPPDMNSSPFLARKGARGMVERVFQHPVKGRDLASPRIQDTGVEVRKPRLDRF